VLAQKFGGATKVPNLVDKCGHRVDHFGDATAPLAEI
jgi:hypothetical protein